MWRVRDNAQIRADVSNPVPLLLAISNLSNINQPNLKKFEYEGVWCLPEGGFTISSPL